MALFLDLVPWALTALLLPPPAGLCVPLAGLLVPRLRAAWGPLALAALLALACTPLLPPTGVPPPPVGVQARRVTGTWREPPTRPGCLQVSGGLLEVELADDVRAPPPGTPVEALLRVDGAGESLVVSLCPLGPTRGAFVDRWAAACSARVRQLVSHDNAGLLEALVLGRRDDLGWPVREAWGATGTTHVLAISGMHVALLATALRALGAAGSWRRPALVIVGFVIVAGAGAPLVRSALGWVLLAVGARLSRPADGLRRLAAVALLMECWQPGLHRDLSAQLSFLAVAGLVAGARLLRGPATLVLGPVGAVLATAPLCAEVFGRFQPWGLVVTPLLTPPLAVLLVLSLVSVLPGGLFSALDPLIAPVLDGTLDLLRSLVDVCARWCPPPLHPPPPPLPGVLLSLLVVAALVALGRRRGPRAAAPVAP
jgi:ComEC/Rec2-related protein